MRSISVPSPRACRSAAGRPGPGLHAGPAVLLLALAVLVLPACGSGGDSPTEPGSGGPSAASVEASSYSRLNTERRAADQPELMLDPVLSEVARNHSERMRDAGFFSHDDPDGSTPASRVAAAGVSFTLLGENLATVSGHSDPARSAHDALMGNAAHRANILNERFSLVGVGVARQGSGYWITQVFIRP